MRIAVDAIGGDYAPEEIIKGTLMAAETWPELHLILVGQQERMLPFFIGPKPTNISFVEASEEIGMDEHPANAVRKKKGASIVVATKLVKLGEADAVVSAGNTGAQMGGWFRKEINSLEDLKGLKMRIPGFAGEVLAKLGAKPTNIPSAELYTALERNTIDALEWVGPSLDLRMGFHKIAPYYYTGWHEPATELQFMVNQEAFDKLPEDLQHILTVAMKTAAYDMYTQSTHESAMNLATLQAEYPNVKILVASAEEKSTS